MKKHLFGLLLASILFLSSCNLKSVSSLPTSTPIQADQGQPVGITPSPTVTPGAQPSNTPIPTIANTPTPTLSPTPSTAMVTPKTEAVNCRFGPGASYQSVGGLKTGAVVPILGQNGEGNWWQIQNPNDIFNNCWVSALVTNTTGSLASVPVVPAPLAYVTLATVNTPAEISVPGCLGPIQPVVFTGTIDVNGPTTVIYHFETQQGGALPAHTLTFTTFGPLNVSESSYTPPVVAGTYWVKLFITAPNSLTAQASYTIVCP
jgi:hypothetical protein